MIPTIADELIIRERLYPFAQTREVIDIRCGIFTIREKWEKIAQLLQPGSLSGLSVPSNLIPSMEFARALAAKTVSPENPGQRSDARFLHRPWHIFEHNDFAIREDFKLITAGRKSAPVPETVKMVQAADIFIEEGARLQHCLLNASTGPIYIGKNTEIMEGALIRGPFALCDGAVVKMGAKIYGATTIGPYSVVGGEIKNAVVLGYSNKAHDGYLGDAVIGEWCNLGAGTSNSNVRNTASVVKAWQRSEAVFEEVGLKCGLIMGDFSRSAINTSFNTGTVVGIAVNYFGEGLSPKYIEDFTWGIQPKMIYDIDKAIRDINNWKKLKNKELSEQEIQTLKSIFENR
jgi:UDP-N-acetylglucosamine diphosphorylase / glucose-1-phosphate thymidylyltransferase / UDP-N-acetylgalactosamine diphosphorylase / glucosamine-1-phosphate N-acetyltransferase / galactosamine-1-phosphate N-acetyltransferase